ncbi:MAG TPA: hypothetical protein VFG84_08415 [Gemmatimonadaceae bacterium]|nr:hypothetical protein [Gemmatimonadaceae bacterium]
MKRNPDLRFYDNSGVDWRIYEVPSSRVPAPRGSNCLIFESDAAIRRVWNYPNDWQGLSEPELAELSWST